MKPQNLFIFILAVALASCSSPKLALKSSLEQQAGTKESVHPESQAPREANAEWLTASIENPTPIISPEFPMASVAGISDLAPTQMEPAKLRKEIKKNIREAVRQLKNMDTKSVKAATAMDKDLKMAAIFGAIGIVLGGLYGVNYIIGFIGFVAIVIALVFLIRWLMRQ